MENLHLLKIEIGVEEYLSIAKYSFKPENLIRLPKYTIAICPICQEENIDHLDTYSAAAWNKGYGGQAFSFGGATHCRHFAFTQPFVHFHDIWPEEANGTLGPEVPYVIGHLLESGKCLAIMHALPICRPEKGKFVPRYTLYMITYFSQDPKSAYDSLIAYNAPYVEPGTIAAFILPQKGYEYWWDLSRWVSVGQLYWVDTTEAILKLATNDVDNFPYKGITGRKYFHMFPYPYPPPWAHDEYGLGAFSE
jgi:hypothetical protein